MPLLGQLFLTSVYLHVNNDGSKFTLWQANPTKDENLVTVGKPTDCTPSPKPSVTPEKKKSGTELSAAATAGVVVGVLVGIAVFILLVFFWRRKRRSGFHPSGAKSPTYDTFKEIVHESASNNECFAGGTGQPHELPWRPIYEMPVPGERSSRRIELDATDADDTPSVAAPQGCGTEREEEQKGKCGV